MELREFVKESLVQVVRGISDAQETVADSGAEIAPASSRIYGNRKDLAYSDAGVIENVSFDVAVTVSSDAATKGGVGIFVAPIALGTRGESKRQDTTVSRIQFSVPVVLPTRR